MEIKNKRERESWSQLRYKKNNIAKKKERELDEMKMNYIFLLFTYLDF